MTVIETPSFVRDAAGLLSDEERLELITYVASNPDAGDVIAGTGGVRKLRWGIAGKGKRGSARVIYYYLNESIPLFLLGAYAKSRKANLSAAERNEFRALVPRLVRGYLKRRVQ